MRSILGQVAICSKFICKSRTVNTTIHRVISGIKCVSINEFCPENQLRSRGPFLGKTQATDWHIPNVRFLIRFKEYENNTAELQTNVEEYQKDVQEFQRTLLNWDSIVRYFDIH